MALRHVGHNCVPWGDCDVCGAKVEPSYRQRTDVCAMCGAGFTVCRCRHQLREWRENMAKLVGASETIDHREVNGWTVTLFHHLPHNGKQPPFSYSASVRENASENVLSYYGETREAVEREVLRIVGVSPPDAASLVEENAALRETLKRVKEATLDYVTFHGPSCEWHYDEPDDSCRACLIDKRMNAACAILEGK